jgi:AcrR family transcriptional regulator
MKTATVTVRDAHRDLTRGRILDAAVAVLTRGAADLTMAAVAEEAGVTERTVFRHFASRDQLFEAVWHWANARIARPGMPRSVEELVAGPRVMFPRFDANESLFRWFVASPQGQAVRLSVKDERQASYLALVRRARPDLGRAAQRRVAATCQLLDSSFAWQSLRDYWDMDGAEAGRAASDAIAALLQTPAPARRLQTRE